MACILLWSSAVRVHDSQAYRKMVVTTEHIRHILEPREILLSFHTGFNLVNAAIVCAILESISGLEPPSSRTKPRYLKLVTVSSFCLLWCPCWCLRCCLSWAWSSWLWSQCHGCGGSVFWHCSILIESASSLECNQSDCGADHLGCARSIFWMLCDDQQCLPTQDH